MRKLLSSVLAVATIMGCTLFPTTAVVTSSDFTAEELDCSSYDIRKYTQPFWEGSIVYNEIVHPIRNRDGSLPSFELMYDASEIVSVKDYRLRTTYVEGVDYVLENGNIRILETGSIHIMKWTDIHPTSVPSGYGSNEFSPYYPHADTPNQWEYWTGGSDICGYSLAVTYIHNDTWDAPVPDSQEKNLPNTFDKLKNDEPLTIVVAGDSVAAGAMSSGFLGMSPGAEAYPEMTERALREKYSNENIELINSAIGGTMSYFEQSKMDNTIIQYNPDLVIINFGMNDSSCDRVGISGAEFRSNLQLQIDYINQKLPDCEVLLLSSLYGNIYTFPAERYEEHAAVLHALAVANDGVGVADPQKIEKYLIEETGKDFLCFQADNMVHPGDFGMRLSAQTIIEALSFEDISTYITHHINNLYEYADLDSRDALKKAELEAVLTDAENTISDLEEEWDINEVVDKAYADMDVIIKRCYVHDYVDTVIPPTCKVDGYTHSVCATCGHSYDHSVVPSSGVEHVMDSGRQTVIPTYKTPGEITYSCARCDYTEKESVPILTGNPTVSGQGMVHFSNAHNYMASDISPYSSGSGFVEFDFCPINIERFDGIPYVGVWFRNYAITACYNFATQEVQIVETSLPFGGGTVHASAKYAWPSNGGEYEYNWKKFAVNINGTTVKIYIDGELVLQDTKSYYQSSNEVALIYSNGECYMDNIKVVKGNYNPATGIGGTVLGSWNINSRSNYNSLFSTWGQQYATKTYTTAGSKNITTGHYAHTSHSGTKVGVVAPDCSHGGYTQYACSSCAAVYFGNYTDPTSDGHVLCDRVVTVAPTETTTGKCTYKCEGCDKTFTEIIPVTEITESILPGDIDGDGTLSVVDLTMFRRYLTGGVFDIPVEAADVDGNGVVDTVDLTYFSRKLIVGTVE